ncbi:uncharacterized protein LOC105160227 isoform X1 [Sesamum indicum]|uniref:Uncharacterized protein LOC105160227 isoform X1 n=1 Tax=Sesamum indicum TaxID=4182 RepID=A0A6I9SY19_SESIN|nr:uncharacterized protein LOC105160227 isoform X1 [Sesamum indicum]
MDFHTLTRRELQTLCKKNKIPANITNVAMADALKTLHIVEGIEEFLQSCQSETAESSIESPERSEVTSPFVPPTGGTSTRRRNVVKEEPETAKPMTRTRRTTQKTLVRDAYQSHADAVETPAVVVQTDRKKGLMASACRKMDPDFKECIREEKKDALMTPSHLGVTTRRRGVKEKSAVNVVYTTRRSARLAKKNMELLNEEDNENSGLFKKDLFNKDGQNLAINLKESSVDLDAISEITGLDANTSMEKKSEGNNEVEVVSEIKQDVPIVDEGEPVSSTEEDKDKHFETDVSKPEVKEGSDVESEGVASCFETEAEPEEKKCDNTDDFEDQNMFKHFETDVSKPEVKEGSDVESEGVGSCFETEAEQEEKKCDNTVDSEDQNMFMPLNASNRIQESEVSSDVHASEIGIAVENTAELNADKVEVDEDKAVGGEADEDSAANYIENVVLESEDHFAVDEVSCDADICNEIEVNEGVLKTNAEAASVFNSDETSDLDVLETKEGSTKMAGMQEVLPGTKLADVAIEEPGEIEVVQSEESTKVLPVTKLDDVAVEEPGEIDAVQSEESTKVLPVTKLDDVAVEEPGVIDVVQSEESTKVLPVTKLDDVAVEEPGEIDAVQSEESTKVLPVTKLDDVAVEEPGVIDVVGSKESTKVLPVTKLDDVAVEEPGVIDVVGSKESTKVLPVTKLDDVAVEEPGVIDVVGSKESTKVLPVTKLDDVAVEEPGEIDAIQSEESTKVTHQNAPSFPGLDSCLGVEPSPAKSKASATKKRMTAVSDNKENMGSGSKLVLTVKTAKNTGENVPKLDELSKRKLTKMLKEKLEMTNKMSKENNEAPARPALKAITENRWEDES